LPLTVPVLQQLAGYLSPTIEEASEVLKRPQFLLAPDFVQHIIHFTHNLFVFK
jgi:hypothetical protein